MKEKKGDKNPPHLIIILIFVKRSRFPFKCFIMYFEERQKHIIILTNKNLPFKDNSNENLTNRGKHIIILTTHWTSFVTLL